ncbi:hypothetical protein SAMN02910456_02415 [Ruminococcaceae bacterium YRB3002]|nr:hypothetical protein SAMN02910456_02415 [Ruminococcaceae bacterium YRB3002]
MAGKKYTSTATELLDLRDDYLKVPYKDTDGTPKTADARENCGDENTLGTGWYAVTGNVVINKDNWHRIACNGEVNILCDDEALSTIVGITVPSSSSLTIWGRIVIPVS